MRALIVLLFVSVAVYGRRFSWSLFEVWNNRNLHDWRGFYKEHVARHNKAYELGQTTYRLKLNHLANYATKLNHISARVDAHSLEKTIPIKFPPFPVPDQFDWRDSDKVSPVQPPDQLTVPAISIAINAVESVTSITRGDPLVQLSTQQVLECSNDTKADVVPVLVYKYLIVAGGEQLRSRYLSNKRI